MKFILNKIKNKLIKKTTLFEGDLVLATFPKSGTTWFRFIWNNIVSIIEFEGQKIDYHRLNGDLKSSIDSNARPKVIFYSLPVLMPTHKPYKKGLLKNNKSIFLYRNPGDTMVSYFEYNLNLKGKKRYFNDFSTFIRSEDYGIKAWCNHFISWQKQSTITISYEEMKGSTFSVIKKTLYKMEINSIEDEVIKKAIERSSFKNIRKMELDTGKDEKAEKTLKKGFVFARKGEVGQWKEYFTREDILYTNKILSSFLIKIQLPEKK